MAVTQVYKDNDAYFKFTDGDKVIINHLSYIDSEDMDFIQRKLTTVYDSNILSVLPTCDCGSITGRYLVGIECHDCSSLCADPKDKAKPVLWFEALGNDIPFINPAFWNGINILLSSKVNCLKWLSDRTYNPNCKIPNFLLLACTEVLGDNRDYRTLINRLPELLTYFTNSTELKSKTSYDKICLMRKIYSDHYGTVLSSYLPIFNKKLFVVENTTKGKYSNILILGSITDCITLWLKAVRTNNPVKYAQATGNVVAKLAELYINCYDKTLLKKTGAFRKHNYGARSNFTFRTVITAAIGKHRHNEICVPWVISVTTYRPHILNKLLRRGYSYKKADKLLNDSIVHFDQTIKEIQDELIRESPYPQGLPVIANRNPSLLQGSSQLFFIPWFNSDPKILTTTLSPLSAKAPNADFDGDEMNFIPLMDRKMFGCFKTLRPFFNIPDLSKPCAVSSRLTLDTPNNNILANYLADKRKHPGDDSLLMEL